MKAQYIIDTKENIDYLKQNAKDLINFGRRFPSPEGGSYYLGDDGTPLTDRARETWITCRMAHVYSIAAMKGAPGCEELARAAIRGIQGELKDEEHGGWYAGITSSGEIMPGKQCYAHAFVILAATSAYLAGIGGAKALLDEALAVYDKYFWNEEEGLSCDTWNTEFTKLDEYRGINANMHTVEAFLAVADALNDDTYRIRAGRIIDRVIGWASKNSYRIPEHFTSDWKPEPDKNKDRPDDPFKPYGATPGHGIEWARLIVQWALSTYRYDDRRSEYIKHARALYDRAVADAWNADGAPGIVYTTDWEGHPVVRDRMHWTLAEAINSSAVLYRVTSDKKYADDYAGFMEYLDTVVLDHSCGSWFHQLDENNRLKGTVWPGKSDLYHAFQAMLIPYSDVEVSIAASVSRDDVRSHVDPFVWKTIVENGYDCIFEVNIHDESLKFHHVKKYQAVNTLFNDHNSGDRRFKTYTEFCEFVCKSVVPEEQESFMEQSKISAICEELTDRGNYTRTVHMFIANERRSKSLRVFRYEGDPDRLFGYVFDISAPLDHDWMTDEYARLGFIDNAERLLAEHNIEEEHFSLIYTNIKGFKVINDLFGAQSGDMVIFQARDILRTLLRPLIMGRLENDHFVLITKDEYLNEQSLSSLASQTYMEGFKQYGFTIRCGIYNIVDRSTTVGMMIDRAKLAEKSVKDDGVHSYVVFNDDVRVNYVKQRVLISDMKSSMETGEFKPYFQAIVDAATSRICSAEALVRWNHNNYGLISPGEFIPAFEDGGQITALDRFMIDKVFDFNLQRAKNFKLIVPCAVNLSRIDFYNMSMMDHLLKLYSDSPLAREYIRIEVTESAYADLEKNAIDYLSRFKAMGVKILLDDFGSGMSSLSTLENFAFDIVKLDMGFVRKIGMQKKAEIIISSVVELSHSLGATVTAEGVETEEQLKFLRSVGCDMIQGYYFFKPVPEEEFGKFLD